MFASGQILVALTNSGNFNFVKSFSLAVGTFFAHRQDIVLSTLAALFTVTGGLITLARWVRARWVQA